MCIDVGALVGLISGSPICVVLCRMLALQHGGTPTERRQGLRYEAPEKGSQAGKACRPEEGPRQELDHRGAAAWQDHNNKGEGPHHICSHTFALREHSATCLSVAWLGFAWPTAECRAALECWHAQ